MRVAVGLGVGWLAIQPGPAVAQTFTSGSTGADGAFNPTATATLTLPPSGVFNFTTVTIPAGVTVRFTRNAVNTPVTILATGDVTIAGTIDVSGTAGQAWRAGTYVGPTGGTGGPGGFDGGNGANGVAATVGGAGLGPGGGNGAAPYMWGWTSSGSSGGHLTAGSPGGLGGNVPGGAAYGTSTLVPLIGGSGGGGGGASFGGTAGGGGGGGGALLIASSGTLTLSGTIVANGANGGGAGGDYQPGGGGAGSGGAVRLAATTIAGGGSISVSGAGGGSVGRIRIEGVTNTSAFSFAGAPVTAASYAAPTTVTLPNAPTLVITSVAGVTAPAAPGGSLASPDVTLAAGTTNPVTVSLAATNVPVGTVVTVTVKGQVGAASTTTATLAGSSASSTASATVTIPTDQPCLVSAAATFTLVAAGIDGPMYADGEEVERVRVSAALGGQAQAVYLTRSGREVLASALR
jgi:hypothetical protein